MVRVKEIKEVFGDVSFYTILNIAKTANKNEVRKAYYQLSLQVHPDRVAKSELASATKKFQALGKIYEVLCDQEKRAIYDETGSVDDECDFGNEDRNWCEYWRLLFPRVKLGDIIQFEETYKGSEEEMQDLKAAYVNAEGDMDQIIDNMMCATVEDDESRFRDIIDGWIKDKTVESYDAFACEKNEKRLKRKRKANAEALEAEEELAKMAASASLGALIQRNQAMRGERADDFFTMLEQKYGNESRSRKGRQNCKRNAAEAPPSKKSTAEKSSSQSTSSSLSAAATTPKNSPAKSKKGTKKKSTRT